MVNAGPGFSNHAELLGQAPATGSVLDIPSVRHECAGRWPGERSELRHDAVPAGFGTAELCGDL